MKEIYRKLKSKHITFQHVAEVGVYLPETSNVSDFIRDGVRTTLVEADPAVISQIKQVFGKYNIQLYPYAVWDNNGRIQLSRTHASTFVSQLEASPALVNDKYVIKEEDTFEVECKKFSEMDDGTIELLSVDIEGSEWYVLKHLKSRPKVISIETHGKLYVNPFIKEIQQWMQENNYRPWFKDGSDTIFVSSDFEITPLEKLSLLLADFRINLTRKRKALLS